MIVNELSINKEVNVNNLSKNVYFTLGKCEIVLNKIINYNKKLRYFLQKNHVLFSLESLTISNSFFKRHNNIKPKIVIVVKQPSFILPEIDISDRIYYYIELYTKIETHL